MWGCTIPHRSLRRLSQCLCIRRDRYTRAQRRSSPYTRGSRAVPLYSRDSTFSLRLTLAYILDHAVCCDTAASSGRSLHLIISQLRSKYTSSNCPNHVRRTKSSIKKRIILRRTVRSMFGEQTFAQLRTSFTSTKPIGLLGTGAQDVHLDFHTAPEL